MRRRLVFALIAAGAVSAGDSLGDTTAGLATHVGTHVWTMKNDRFGGMSGIEVDGDGRGFVALSDRGAIVAGVFERDAEGRIDGIDAGPLGVLRGRSGGALSHSRADSEGLVVAPDGAIYVSFEIGPRVLRYSTLHGKPAILPIPREFSQMVSNGALEALALGPDGAIYTLPEESIREDGSFSVYRFRNGDWDQPFALPRDGDFLPVGADFGPDGRLYLLERDFGLLGFSTRVRRFVLTADGIGAGETLLQTRAGTFGDLEGIGVWRDPQGRLRLTMIADDNFSPLLRTQIVEYTVRD